MQGNTFGKVRWPRRKLEKQLREILTVEASASNPLFRYRKFNEQRVEKRTLVVEPRRDSKDADMGQGNHYG
jgi:hypothetical protein